MPSRQPPKGEKTKEPEGRDPHDFYDFGPFKPASKEYLDRVMPEHLKALIAKRRKDKKSG